MKYRQRVAVIGGGLAGLAAALYLARSKRIDVHVFEKSAVPGGRARTTEKNGLLFNLGAHALYARGAAREVLDELGIRYSGGMPALTGNEFIADGRRLPMPTGAASLLGHSDFTLREKWELMRVLIALRNAGAGRAHQSARAWLQPLCRSPRVRQFFEGLFRLTTYAADLDLLSADAAIAQFKLSGSGVMYLDGGWQTLIEGLVRANRTEGATLHPNVSVAKLKRKANGRVALQFARETPGDDRDAEFDCVLLACDPTNAARLARDLSISIDAENIVVVRAACLDVGLTALPRPCGLVLDLDRRLYLSVHSNSARLVSHSSLAKNNTANGPALIHLAKYLRRDESPDDARGEMESLLDTTLPGWRNRVIDTQYLPRIAVAQDLPDATRGGLAGRVPVDQGAGAGVYFAGDWVGDHGLLSDAALASARLAAQRILARPTTATPGSLLEQHLTETGAVASVR